MFKKALSVFLCIVMCISFFSITAVETLAAYNARALFSVKGEAVENNKLSYSISVTKEQNGIGGIILEVKYDSTVLKPVNCAPAERTSSEEGTVRNFEGTYAYGVSENDPDTYSIAYMNTVAVSTTDAVPFFNIEFEVIDENHPKTDIRFFCKEYYSISEPDKNITVADGIQLIAEFEDVSTLEKPVLKNAVPYNNGLKVSWEAVEGALGYEIRRKTVYTTWETVGEVGADKTEFVDTGLTSGTNYIYTVLAFNADDTSVYDANGVSCKYVEKPVVTSVVNAVGGVEVKWSATFGADFYILLRREAGQTEWEEIAKRTYSAGTTYKDTTAVDGVTYEYDVNSATDTFTSVTAESGMSVTYITSPGISSVKNALNGVEIIWNAHPGATHYIVYRKAVGTDTELLEYAEVTRNSYIDVNVVDGKVYTYSVKACTNNGDSAYSPTGYTITRVPSTEVTALSIEKSAVKVEWNAVSGVTGYAIYRRNVTDSIWVKAGSVDGATLSFSDTGVVSGNEYVYAVCPMMSVSEGAKSESAPVYFIKAPEGTVAENVIEGIEVSWIPVNGATGYEVMRADAYGEFVKIADVSADEALKLIDTDVEWREHYIYAVKAISPKGESLVGNGTASIMRIGALGFATPEIADGGIKVTWESYEGADGYVVYKNSNGTWVEVATVENAEYLDTNVTTTKVYSYAVAVIIDGSRGILDTGYAPELKYIAPPQNLTAANGSNYSTISWQAVEGAISYEIYKAEDSTSPVYSLLATVGSATLSYTDNKVVAGKTYNYVIRANDGEKSSADSNVLKNTFLAIPQITSIANAYTGVTFSWNAVAGAESYRVYRKIYGDKYWSYITTVSGDTLSFTDTGATNGKIMCYTVKAENSYSMSAYLAKCMTYITAPQLAFSNSTSGVYLKWDKNDSAVSYWVYRKLENSKYWTRIAMVTTPYYTDRNVVSGTNYLYTIKAYSGQILSNCNMDGWKIKHLSSPKLASAANGYGAVTVQWNKVPGAAAYYVYRKVDNASTWTCVAKTTALLYRDTDVKNRSTYTYTVRAYYGSEISGFDAAGKSIKFLTAPTATVVNRAGNVELNWNSVLGASNYYVYRKAARETTWTRIASVTTTSYVDKTVYNGTAYTYTVKAYGSGTLSGCNLYGWSTIYLAPPKLVSAKSYASGITIKWQTVKWSTGYFIFRKTSSGNWVQIGTVTGANNVTFVDKTAQMGFKYTYTVRAYYGNYRSWFEPGLICVDDY